MAKLQLSPASEITMGLFRLLFWIALIAIAFWLWRRFTRPTPRQQQRPQDCGVVVILAHAKRGSEWLE
ncbi:hypothetical protein I8R55_30630, partial [Pseudomonas aeruginosa]|nr:hypothetical protein [Pseudomonas aeruginosa]